MTKWSLIFHISIPIFPQVMGKKSVNKELLWKIAKRVKTLREEKGITQEVFYNDTGIHIGRIERAQRNISVTTLDQICTYLEVDLAVFFKELGSN